MNNHTTLDHEIDHFIYLIRPTFPKLVKYEQEHQHLNLSDAIHNATHTIIQIVKHIALQPYVFQDPMRVTPSDPIEKIQYITELLIEDLRVLINEHSLSHRNKIIEISSWEEFSNDIMLPAVFSAIDDMISFEAWKLNEAQREIEWKSKMDAIVKRVAKVQREEFFKQHGYNPPGTGPIAHWGP